VKQKTRFSVGDRVVANTDDWGRFTGVVIEVAFGRYLKIQNDSDSKIYGVPAAACRPLPGQTEPRPDKT